jgi:hypothetical protein
MSTQFKSMNELVEYLGRLEERIKALETENGELRTIASSRGNIDGNMIGRAISTHIPQTNLLNPSFLKRAFTVWGHFFVANLMIGAVVFVIYLCLMMVFFGSLLGNLPKVP